MKRRKFMLLGNKGRFWKAPIYVLCLIFLSFFFLVGFLSCFINLLDREYFGFVAYTFTTLWPYYFMRFGVALAVGTLMPVVLMHFSCLFLLRYWEEKEKMFRRIAILSLICLAFWLLMAGTYYILDTNKWIFLSGNWDEVFPTEKLSPIRPMSVLFPLVHLVVASIGWLILRRKNKQVAVSAPVSETADAPTK